MTIGVRVVRVRSFDVILYLWMPRACVAFQGFGRPLVPFAARATEQLKDGEECSKKKLIAHAEQYVITVDPVRS